MRHFQRKSGEFDPPTFGILNLSSLRRCKMGKMDTMGEKKYSYHAISRAYRTRTMPLFRFPVPADLGKPTPSSVDPREGEIRTPRATSLSATKCDGSGLQLEQILDLRPRRNQYNKKLKLKH